MKRRLKSAISGFLRRHPRILRLRERVGLLGIVTTPAPYLSYREGLVGTLTQGPDCVIAPGTEFDLSGDITLGQGVHVGRDCLLLTHRHPDFFVDGAPHTPIVAPITVGDYAVIGDRAIILPQVSVIGRYAIVGAGSVVTKDVPDMAVVAGNPARIIRMRFTQEDGEASPE